MMASQILLYIVPFLAAMIIIVFIHEYGHFKVARLCGVNVTDFSIGFGPEVASWTDRHNTRWKLCWLPLGGYVKFEGDTNAASAPDGTEVNTIQGPRSFPAQPLWKKAAIVSAGPLANFIFAIAIFTIMLGTLGEQVLPARVGELEQGSAAQAAGLQPGDYVREINGRPIRSFMDLRAHVITGSGTPLKLKIERDKQFFETVMTPRPAQDPHPLGGTVNVVRLGIKPVQDMSQVVQVTHSYGEAFKLAIDRTWFTITASLRVFARILTGNGGQDQLGGVMSIANGAATHVIDGLPSFLQFVGFISISIGLINLFPIPMLDGGHLMFYAIEAVRGRPLGPMAQEWALRIGVGLVLLLMLVGNVNDVVRVFFS
jgi:regulator of sigma E protease